MARQVKRQKVGMELKIWRDLRQDGTPGWESHGLFMSRYLAHVYLRQNYPNAKRYLIQGVRVNVEKLVVRTGADNVPSPDKTAN